MPSSPPAWFGVYEDEVGGEDLEGGGLWGDGEFGGGDGAEKEGGEEAVVVVGAVEERVEA